MFGPLLRKEETLHIRNVPKVGGSLSYKARREGHEIDHVGMYLELDRPRRIVFTWSIADVGDDDPSSVTIDITPTADGCSLRLVYEMSPEWINFIVRSRDGWRKMLGVLATLLYAG